MSLISGIGNFLRKDVLNPIEGAVSHVIHPGPQQPQQPQQSQQAPRPPQLILKSGIQPGQMNQGKINLNPSQQPQVPQPPQPNLHPASLTKNPLVGSPSKPGPNSTMKIASATPPVKNGMNQIKINAQPSIFHDLTHNPVTNAVGNFLHPQTPAPTAPKPPTTPHDNLPQAGDMSGLTHALRGINALSPDDQVRVLNRSAQSGLIPRNVSAAYINQILSPSPEGDRTKAGMLAQSLEDVLLPGSSIYKQIGTTLGENKLYDQALKGHMNPGIVQNVAAQANAENGGIVNPDNSINPGHLTAAGINEALKAATLGMGATGGGLVRDAEGAVKLGPTALNAGKTGIKYGVPMGVSQSLYQDANNPKQWAINIAKGVGQATALPLATDAAGLIGEGVQNRLPLDEVGAVGKNVPSPAPGTPPEEPRPLSRTPEKPGQGSGPNGEVTESDKSMFKDLGGNPNKLESLLKMDAEKRAELNQKVQMAIYNFEHRNNIPTSPNERAKIIQQPGQQTNYQPADFTFKPEDSFEGRVRSGIAQAMGKADELISQKEQWKRLASNLSDNDKAKLSDAINGEDVGKVDNPDLFNNVVEDARDLMDQSLAIRRQAGATTLKYNNGKYAPLFHEASTEAMDKLGIPEEQRYELNGKTGFNEADNTVDLGGKYGDQHDVPRKYQSYRESGEQTSGILKPANKNAIEDIDQYISMQDKRLRDNLLFQAMQQAAPEHIAEQGFGRDAKGNFTQAAGRLPFYASKDLNKLLKNFKNTQPESTVGKAVETGLRYTGKATKKTLFLGSVFHQAHITENVGFATALGGERGAVVEGLMNAAKSKGGLSKTDYYSLLDHYRNDGVPGVSDTVTYARNMGLTLPENSAMSRFINGYALSLAKAAKEGGIDATSEMGVDLGKVYNHLLGRENAPVEGVNPTLERMTSYFTLAPHYIRTQLSLVYEAMAPKKLGGAGYDRPFSIKTPGGAARSAVLGPRVFGALFAVTASAIVMNRFPTWQDVKNEAGLNPNNTNPNINIKSKNSKGERQVFNLPTDPLGLAVGFVTDPQHFLQSRYSPVLSFAAKVATNKNWNSQPLVDANQPGQWPKRIVRAAENSLIPIGIQNFTNLQRNPNNPNLAQGAAQEFGFRLKTDPNDPQVQANKAYFKAFNEATNILKNSGQFGQYWAQEFNALHPKNTTDAEGNKYPTPYNPVSSEQKYAAYTAVDKNGRQSLSPVFYADQRLANMTKGYPSSPLYKLNGNGIDAEGNNSPKALVALQYQHAQDPAAKQVIMNANGGQNGWLAKYEDQVGKYSQNYQQNLTNYFKSLGWSSTAVNDYWKKHPSTPDPIDQPNFDKPTNDLINQYYQLSASGDSTAASKFFSDHADTLGNAFDLLAQHANALHAAKGELQMEGYPDEPQNVKNILASMPQGSDKASKRARAQIINANPDVNQYLANVSLYETLSKGAQFRYKNPLNMNNTQAQNLYAGGNNAQGFLKSAKSLGTYDIGYNPNAPAGQQYQFMGGAGTAGKFGAGYKSTSGSGKGSKSKTPHFITKHSKLPRRPHTHKMKKTYLKYSSKTTGKGGAGVKIGKARKINFASTKGMPINQAKAPSSNAIKYAGV